MADRSRRRCVLRKAAVPDATHYVGYVEDDETPEMIMKKFEEVERIKAAAGVASSGKRSGGAAAAAAAAAGSSRQATPSSSSAAAAGPGSSPTAAAAAAAAATADTLGSPGESQLDHAALQQVFKATSMYNVKSLLGNNEALMVDATSRLAQDRGSAGPASDLAFDSDSEDDLVAELRGFWSDDDWSKPSKQKKERGSKRARGEGSSSGRGGGRGSRGGLQRNTRTCLITQYNRDSHAFIRRRMRVVDPDAILQLRVPPPPLPLSWGKAVRHYRPVVQQVARGSSSLAPAAAAAGGGTAAAAPTAPRGLLSQPHALPASRNCDPPAAGAAATAPLESSCRVLTTSNIASLDFAGALSGHTFQAVLINTGWESAPSAAAQQQKQQEAAGPGPSSQAAAAAGGGGGGVPSWSQKSSGGGGWGQQQQQSASRLAALPIPSLCPRGFVMIWADKEHLSGLFKQMSAWGFSYVENLTWVLTGPSHAILRLPYPYIKRSHITLYIFRKDGEGRDIELRHQRNADVVFDCVRAVEGREWDVPAEVFDTIETLLPTGKGLFLELWAPTAAGRAGWTHVVESSSA